MSLHINKQLTKNASLAHAKNAGNRNEVQVKVNSEPHATLNEYEPSRPRAGLKLSNSRDYGNAPRIRVARTATPPLTPRIRGARTERVAVKRCFTRIWCGFIAPNLLAPNLIPPTEKKSSFRLFQVSVSQHLSLCSKGALVGTDGMEENPTLPLTPLPTTRHYCPLQQGEQSTAQGEATRDRQLSPRTREGSVRMACGGC
ncbi:hypothetical protein J6590_091140 [Homalodisca vitripennis]|nr:hypothetical protein J6590_091140 [Homalodisca vitripennis]